VGCGEQGLALIGLMSLERTETVMTQRLPVTVYPVDDGCSGLFRAAQHIDDFLPMKQFMRAVTSGWIVAPAFRHKQGRNIRHGSRREYNNSPDRLHRGKQFAISPYLMHFSCRSIGPSSYTHPHPSFVILLISVKPVNRDAS
jgi:hypothetical protein